LAFVARKSGVHFAAQGKHLRPDQASGTPITAHSGSKINNVAGECRDAAQKWVRALESDH
jgi:hypothetical protein